LDEAIEAGHYNNKPESANHIDSFVKYYSIDMSQFNPSETSGYQTFNEFFTRHVRPECRPVASQQDDTVLTSPADSRLTVFDSIDQAKSLLIKGKNFTLPHLVGDDDELVARYKGGRCFNVRLVPQDYHRFHSPMSGKVTHNSRLGGTSFTTQKQALQSSVNVLISNERELVEVTNETTGVRMLYISIGAAEVGKVTTLVEMGQQINKGDEIGYFSYGGSDIFVLFDTSSIEWDNDIKEQSQKSVETYIQCNQHIGKIIKAAK